MAETRLFVTRTCIVCGLNDEIRLDAAKVARWQAGEHVQNVWPEMPAPRRELLITGTHPACWDKLFG